MKLGIIAASLLIGAASLASTSANAQTSPTLKAPKNAIAAAGALPSGPTTVRTHSFEETSAVSSAPLQPAPRVAPGN